MQTYRLAFLLLTASLLAGCVGIEAYERKADEAASLRREIDAGQREIQTLRQETERLQTQIEQKDVENQELAQSLTMSRRHNQQIETRVADLRARESDQRSQKEESATKAMRLQRSYETTRAEVQKLKKERVNLRAKLARFEDKIRFQAEMEKDIKAQLLRERQQGIMRVRRSGDRVVISIESLILFKSGSAKIRTDGKALLIKLSRLLRRYANREVQVQGHTDNLQISDRLAERWETNWELSAARATRVLRYFVEEGNLDPRRASAAGMGEFRPITSNDTRGGRRRNRRLEILMFPPDS